MCQCSSPVGEEKESDKTFRHGRPSSGRVTLAGSLGVHFPVSTASGEICRPGNLLGNRPRHQAGTRLYEVQPISTAIDHSPHIVKGRMTLFVPECAPSANHARNENQI